MWQSAHGIVLEEDVRPGCANAILQHYASWWYHHDPSRRSAHFGQRPDLGQQLSVEQIWVSRPEMSVRLMSWAMYGDNQYALWSEQIVRPGLKRFASRSGVSQDRFFQSVQETRTEEEIQVHAWYGHGFAAMALLRPAWMLHGRHVVEEWDDDVDGVPVVRRRARRVIPFDDPRMMGDELNPTVMDHAEEVVFSYDPEYDVIREWHDVWEGEPCTSCRILDLRFDRVDGIGGPYAIRPIEDNNP